MTIKLDPKEAEQISAEQTDITTIEQSISNANQVLQLRKECLSRLLRGIIRAEGIKEFSGSINVQTINGEKCLVVPDDELALVPADHEKLTLVE